MMTKTIDATFDGKVFQPDEAFVLEPNTRVRLTIETIEPKLGEPYSFLDLLASLNMEGPADWSERFEEYSQELIDNEANLP
jgi:hypothetical protein